jgi:hypothetical protein
MSQRLKNTKPGTIIGYRRNGQPIFVIAGSSGTDPVPPVEGTPPADGTPNPEGDGTNTGDNTGDKTPDPVDVEKALERMRAADRAKSAAEQALAQTQQKLREYEDKDKTELEKAQRDAAEKQAALEQTQLQLKQAQVHNAFLLNNTYQWHNSERALSLLDLSDVTIADDGKVTGLDKAIEALAKSDPYLLMPKDDTSGSSLPPSGSNVGGGAPGSKGGKADRDKLLEKYPALRR